MQTRYRLLHVEDNPGDADLAQLRLEECGRFPVEVIRASTLADANVILERSAVDAVILDLNLPDSSGLDTLRGLRSPNVAPVVIVSGQCTSKLRREVVEEGAEDLISKEEANSRLFGHSILHAIERNRALEQHRKVQELLDTTPDAILVVEASGVVRFVNDAALKLFQRRREEFIGELVGFSMPNGGPIEVRIPRRDGVRICEMRVVPFEWHGEPGLLGSIRDITDLQVAQQRAVDAAALAERRSAQLRELFSAIGGLAEEFSVGEISAAVAPLLHTMPALVSDEVVKGTLSSFEREFRAFAAASASLEIRNRELAESKQQLEVATEELHDLSYSLALDLRRPLHHVGSFTRLLLEARAGTLDGESQKALNYISEAAQTMNTMVAGLMEFAHVCKGAPQRIAVDLTAMCQEIGRRTCAAHPQRSLRFDVVSQMTTHADPERLRAALTRLIAVAVATSGRSDARIEIGSLTAGPDRFYFIRNNGDGLDAEVVTRMFGSRAGSACLDLLVQDRMGLALVKRVIEQHAGRVWAKVLPGEGTTFYFSLPTGRSH